MLSISKVPVSLSQMFYKSGASTKARFRSFLTNRNIISTVSIAEKKNGGAESILFSNIDLLNLSNLVSVFDLRGNIIHANEMLCKSSGYSLRELLCNKYFFIYHSDTTTAELDVIWDTIAQGNTWQGEMKNRTKNGSVYWTAVTVTPVNDANGKPSKFISTHLDITRQKEMEAEIKLIKKKRDSGLQENLEHAKYMHSAILNNKTDIKNIRNEVFLLFKEKKIVSGDFYKIEERDNKLTFIIGDSMGHGISASYISVLALNSINRALKLNRPDPASLLSSVNDELYQVTHVEGKRSLSESADMMACSLDLENSKLTYASAKMRGFVVREGEVILLEKDKCSIGETSREELNISNRTINLEKGDCLYVFSDGLIDQFGGPNDKRIGMKKIMALAREVNNYSMSMQKKVIEVALSQWQSKSEQTDDMTMFGIRI